MLSANHIKDIARAVGFDACGITSASIVDTDTANGFKDWLSFSGQAQLRYMEQNVEKRLNPTLLVEGVKSIVAVQLAYKPGRRQSVDVPNVSCYAYGQDYHLVIKQKGKEILHLLREQSEVQGQVFVDTAPILEKYWAVKAGLGWIGKNSILVSKRWGTYTFLGLIFLNEEVDRYDTPLLNVGCGDCSGCMEACPTGAIVKPMVVDAKKCISYQTVECKTEGRDLNRELGMSRGKHCYIFGCDICQEVCPWNVKVQANEHEEFLPLPHLLDMTAEDWLKLDDEAFKEKFQNSSLRRAGLNKIKNSIKSVTPK
ncbi:MAG: tRNA epoxyqueuosine(34) reductase QueG [Prevotellaceae bacterium]|jgi:epoxyqueuosine reductase|nr:tRNA epoxyqueuosine(34) reductase QueG [Prevotellaceae bacterium]